GTPLVLVHGAEDSVIPIDTAEQIYSQATGPKYFLRVAGVGHNDVVAPTSAPFGVVTRAIGAVLEWTSQGESPEEALLAATEDEPTVSLEADP
ncbi:MAG TPA: alpha/beta hydrolase, partial [Acidimicrobiales bacterium]|nr:alpha/beta hydrolase [Acidimicrobiales bacterium]